MKNALIGLWLTIVALGSTYGAAMYLSAQSAASTNPQGPATVSLQHDKTRVLNVPIIRDGSVQGFVSVQMEFVMDGAQLKSLPVPPEVYLVDEAFRTLYGDNTSDFNHLEKYDLGKLTKHLVESTNAHLGAPLIKDVLIADMNYSPKDNGN